MVKDENSTESGIAILGGGVAGLMAALSVPDAHVYEAEPDWGGAAASDTCDGFTFDRGIHVLQTTNQIVVQLLRECGVPMREFTRNAFIYAQGKYTPYPFQVNTTDLPITTRLKCVWSFLQRKRYPEPNNYDNGFIAR